MLVCTAGSLSGCAWVNQLGDHRAIEAHELALQARSAEADGDWNRAADLLTQASETDSADSDVRRQLAGVLVRQGHLREAADELQMAVESVPDDVECRVELARVLIDLEDYDGAREHIATALENEPDCVKARLLNAQLAEQSRDADEALDNYLHVLAVDDDQVPALLGAAESYIQLGTPTQACPLLNSVCRSTRPTCEQQARAHWLLGVAYGREQRWNDAASVLSAAAEQGYQMTADDRYRLAYAHLAGENVEAAAGELSGALAMEPNHSNALAMATMLHRESLIESGSVVQAGYSNQPFPVPQGWQPMAQTPTGNR